ncbi:MAG: SufB/SufD family protein [Pleomorphochaeta sp.]
MLEKTMSLLRKLYGDIDFTNAAVNVRENCSSCQRQNIKNVTIEDMEDKSGINIYVKAGAKGEKVYIPAVISKSNITDIVKNVFYIEAGADVVIQAGCALHTDGKEKSIHNGIHRFFIGENAKVKYYEKHLGEGSSAQKDISPVTEIFLDKDASFYMDSIQLDGVNYTKRETKAIVKENAKLDVNERILTQDNQEAISLFDVEAVGDNSSVNIVSRSVAKGNSKQTLRSNITGNSKCTGHSECDAILEDNGVAIAIPALVANHPDATLVHEAAIGRISKQQIEKLQTLGLNEEDAEKYIVKGFLK